MGGKRGWSLGEREGGGGRVGIVKVPDGLKMISVRMHTILTGSTQGSR